MKLDELVQWLDRELDVAAFDDVSNNGVQVARRGTDVTRVAVAVDASAKSVRAATAAGAQVLIVHHGISWGGGIKRLTGGVYEVVRAAMDADLAVYACHLPLDAHPTYGNNVGLAHELGLADLQPAFSWRGRVIGFVGRTPAGERVGVCSGGGGGYAEEAKRLGCVRLVTGEADWGERIAAENCGIELDCRGHYETEVYGVRAVGAALTSTFALDVVDLT